MSKKKQHFTEDFKKQMVAMYNNGKSATVISEEYGMAKSTLHKWISNYSASGSFKTKDNRTEEENELIRLRKQNKQLLMENDIFRSETTDFFSFCSSFVLSRRFKSSEKFKSTVSAVSPCCGHLKCPFSSRLK